MALATYTDLQGAVAGWVHREDDDDLTARVPDLIALGEARIFRVLRLRRMLTTAMLATTSGVATVALPADFLHFHRLRLTAPDQAIDYLPGRSFSDQYPAAYSGAPRHYTVEGANIVLAPVPDSSTTIEAVYYARPAALSVTPSNWLLTEHPGLYLWSALAEAAPFLRDTAMVQAWEGKLAAEIADARTADALAARSGSGLRVRVR